MTGGSVIGAVRNAASSSRVKKTPSRRHGQAGGDELRERRRHEQIAGGERGVLGEPRDLEETPPPSCQTYDGAERNLAFLAGARPRIDARELDEGAAEERPAVARLGQLAELELHRTERSR